MDGQLRAKVISRRDHDRSRPASPTKHFSTSLSPPPVIRPKAKVNSSATIAPRKNSATSTSGGSSHVATAKVSPSASIPRAPSPFKPSQLRNNADTLSPPVVKAKVTSRPHSVIAGDTRQRAFTSSSPSSQPASRDKRRGSFSSTLTAPVSARTTPASSPSTSRINALSATDDSRRSPSPSLGSNGRSIVRVKSKISRLAEPPHSASLPPSPSLPSAHRPFPSASAINVKVTPPLPTLTPGAASTPGSPTSAVSPHHRFATTREVHHAKHESAYQSFASAKDDQGVSYGSSPPSLASVHMTAKVDPSTIPLPPQSPPISTLSFSSRSSASKSSVSYGSDARETDASRSTAPTLHSRVNSRTANDHPSVNPKPLSSPPLTRSGSNVDGLGIRLEPSLSRESDWSPVTDRDQQPELPSSDSRRSSFEDGGDDAEEEDEDRKMKAQAKSIRKIADLEITNRSLMAINASLEATKHKQAKEIRDLRRKLRESRLILPPPTFRAVAATDNVEEEEEEDEEEEEEEEDEALVSGRTDEAYRRVRSLIESLLDQGRKALEARPEDLLETKSRGAKVLHEIEARTWRGEDADTQSILSADDRSIAHLDVEQDLVVPSSRPRSRSTSPSRVPIPDDSDGTLGSESEVEASLMVDSDSDAEDDHIPNSRRIPPITVTPSS
ncbi:hypothetical protein K474DRAFT_1701108 [Panus rudis PR-1116 ss-1]|nr:hypothetical protein K474DRAFT_1701108 [Panus rudis PR-1116 ss-1]